MNTNNPYHLPNEEYQTVIHFARQYPLWVKELQTRPDTIKAITYDGEKVQTSCGYDPTIETAMRRTILENKCRLIEETAREAGTGIYRYLLRGVTQGVTFWELRQQGMPCGKNYYTKCRQRFYWSLAQKI